MSLIEKPLIAVYKNGLHLGNVRAPDDNEAIKRYLLDAGYSKSDLLNIEFINQYTTVLAIKDKHY